MNTIPESHKDLLNDDKKAFLYLATIMQDGSPQATPVWFNTDATHILINSAEGRVKDKNMRARPMVAVVIADPANPYRTLQIRGKVVKVTLEGADEHIDALAFKYMGVSTYPNRSADERRVTYIILPKQVDAG